MFSELANIAAIRVPEQEKFAETRQTVTVQVAKAVLESQTGKKQVIDEPRAA